jgi:hypothetical protein
MSEKISRTLYLEWDGVYGFDELHELDDESCDYGVYQIYGMHPVYGAEVLLYIGKAQDQTFAKKLGEERAYWEAEGDFQPMSLCVGRLAGAVTPSQEDWRAQIDQAARLLVYAHAPVFNGRGLASLPDEDLKELHVVNWGGYMDLSPEVSGARWLYRFTDLPTYNVYGKHAKK